MKRIFYGCSAEEVVLHYVNRLTQSITHSPPPSLTHECGVVAFADSQEYLWGQEYLGLPIVSPATLAELDVDEIHILSFSSTDVIYDNLVGKWNVPARLIKRDIADGVTQARETFVASAASMLQKQGITGSAAEGGVFQGAFSKVINACFPESKLYLFDTFEGFAESDVSGDEALGKSVNKHSHFADTSVQCVLDKLPYPDRAVVRKGYFPDTAEGIDDEFVFVNLDFDLYAPIKAGLEWFFPRMKRGGVILVHDYFAASRFDTAKAVDEFCEANGLMPLPIGDVLSVAIIKQ
jgi:O-methyltransferase